MNWDSGKLNSVLASDFRQITWSHSFSVSFPAANLYMDNNPSPVTSCTHYIFSEMGVPHALSLQLEINASAVPVEYALGSASPCGSTPRGYRAYKLDF